MSGQLMDDDRTSFGQQDENHDEIVPSAPASLPSVPSFGTEDWRHFRFNAVMDSSTTSASPISSCFPGFASSGSSAGIVRSYSTTPLSSTSIEIPRSSWPSLLETSSQVQLAESNSTKHTKFIIEDPSVAKHKMDKAMRACTPCFTKRLECSDSGMPNRCMQCIGKDSYCKGPIETPRLLDLEWLDVTIAAFFGCFYGFTEAEHGPENLKSIEIELRLEPFSEQDIMSNSQTHHVQIPGLRENFRFLWVSSNLEDVLDASLAVDLPLCMAPKSGLYDLSSYERLCRRFCACLSLLRRQDECTLDKTYKDDHRCFQVVVGFLCQLARTASSTFAEMFEHIRGCCFANRDRRGTPNLMFILAEHLGHMHREIRHFMDIKRKYPEPLPLSGLLPNALKSLDELEKLGRGLCPKAFESTYQSPALDIAGLHLIPRFEPQLYTTNGDTHSFSQYTSFSDILCDFAPYQLPYGNEPVPTIYKPDTSGPWQNIYPQDSGLLVGHGLQDEIGNSQDMNFEDNAVFGLKGLQAEANATLDLGWTQRFDDFAASQSIETNVSTNQFHPGILDPILHARHVDWGAHQPSEVPQAGCISLRATGCTGPKDTDTGCSLLASSQGVMAPSQTPNPRLETANRNAVTEFVKSLCSMPVPRPEELPKRASKRKRIKTALSRKKPCLPPSLHSYNADSRALKKDFSSKLTSRKEAAKTTVTNDRMSSKQPSHVFPGAPLRADWMPAWEPGKNGYRTFDNAGIARGIKVLESERRPMSWPYRNHWRKSLDISVAVLTKGFEKLMTEKGESSVSAV